MSHPPGLPPEGWYPNPDDPQQQRWWDGQSWTEHVAVGAPMAPGYEQRTPPSQQQQPYQPYQPQQQPYQPQPPYQPQQQPYQPQAYQPYPQQPAGYGGYPAYPAAALKGVLPDGARVAGWWWRVLARWLDGLVTLVPTLLLGAPLIKHVYDQFRDWFNAVDAANRLGEPMPQFHSGNVTRDILLLGLIGGGVTIVYELLMLKFCAATVGKLACGLRVRAWEARGPLSWAAVGKRVLAFQVAAAVPQVGGLYYLIDVLWPLWDQRKQALHDKVAGTAVVKRHDAELAPQTYGGATSFGSYQPR